MEYIEAFMDLYTNAIKTRMRSLHPICTTLSGGLDSGSVTTIAAKLQKEKGKQLTAFTSVPICDVDNFVSKQLFGDEMPFAKATADYAGNVDIHPISAENTSPLAGIKRSLDIHEEPGHAAGNAFWIVSLLDTAKSMGFGTLLTGQSGNAVVSWHGSGYLASVFKKRQWNLLCRELTAWSS